MFIGREEEIRTLKKQLESSRKNTILLYGRRRVGKTALIREVLNQISDDTVIIYHEFHQVSLQQNCMEFSRSAALALGLPSLPPFNNIPDIFRFISTLGKKTIIVMDEYSDLKKNAAKGEVDSYMRSVIDNLGENIKLIVMGSLLKIMEELLDQDNPLFGRFTAIMKLEPFNYLDASGFFPEKSHYEQIELYSVFGGSPYVLSLLDPHLTVRENIEESLLPVSGSVRAYIEAVINQEVTRVPHGLSILSLIGNGKRKYQELEDVIGREAKGVLAGELKKLIELEVISKTQPINKTGKTKCFYEITDPLLRFYFAYIYPNPSLMLTNPSIFYANFIAGSITDFIARRFEGCVREYFTLLVKKGIRNDIMNIGTYWYDDRVSRRNGEFDIALQTMNGYEIYDAKFYRKPFTEKEAEKEHEQIVSTALGVSKWGIIAASGFEKENNSYIQLTLEDLYIF